MQDCGGGGGGEEEGGVNGEEGVEDGGLCV